MKVCIHVCLLFTGAHTPVFMHAALVGHLCQGMTHKHTKALQLKNSLYKAALLLLCLPCHYNYKGHLTLKPHSLSPHVTYG